MLDKELILLDPQTSLRITEKGYKGLYSCIGKELQWCLANSQISQWNMEIFWLTKSFENRDFKYLKLGWPNLKCYNIISSLLFLTKKDPTEEPIGPDWCMFLGSSSR